MHLLQRHHLPGAVGPPSPPARPSAGRALRDRRSRVRAPRRHVPERTREGRRSGRDCSARPRHPAAQPAAPRSLGELRGAPGGGAKPFFLFKDTGYYHAPPPGIGCAFSFFAKSTLLLRRKASARGSGTPGLGARPPARGGEMRAGFLPAAFPCASRPEPCLPRRFKCTY